MIAKKFIENKKEGEYEIIRKHVKEVKEPIQLEWICEKLWLCDEEPETAYFTYGLSFDWDSLYCVDVDKFIDAVKEHIHERQEDDEEFIDEDDIKKIFESLELMENYRGYDIEIKEE